MKSEFSTKTLIYLRAAELVEMGHSKRSLARWDGMACSYNNPSANQFCYHGALLRAKKEITGEGIFKASPMQFANWNDEPLTTGSMVAQKLREQAFE